LFFACSINKTAASVYYFISAKERKKEDASRFYFKRRASALWQRVGESYEHVLMKALGYAMFVSIYPNLEIETKIGLRYKPDLIARKGNSEYEFWGECGQNSIRKTHWI
jgi:hypothetical protein